VTAVDDDWDEHTPHQENITYTITSTDSNYNSLATTYYDEGSAMVRVDVMDNDVARVNISCTELLLTEGNAATATYAVVLDTKPYDTVRVAVAASAGICATTAHDGVANAEAYCDMDSDCAADHYCKTGTSVTLSVAYVDFTSTNWATPQEIVVSAVDDFGREAHASWNGWDYHLARLTHTATSTSDPAYTSPAALGLTPITVKVVDNDEPTAFLTVNAVATSSDIAGASTTLTFTLVCDRGLAAAGKIVVTLPPSFVAIAQASDLTVAATSGLSGTLAVDHVGPGGYNVSISRGGSAADLAAGTTVVFTIAGVTNPQRSGAPAAFPLIATTLADPMHTVYEFATTATLAVAIVPAAFSTQPTVALDSVIAGDVVTATLSFTTTNPIPADGRVLLELPSAFTTVAASPTISLSSGMSGTATAISSGLAISITRGNDGAIVVIGATVVLTIYGIKIPQYVVTTTVYPTLRTLWSDGTAAIDEASSSYYSSTRIAPMTTTYGYFLAPAPVFTPASLVAGATGSAILSVVLKNPLPANGRIALTLPATFGLTTVSSVAAISGIDGTFAVAHTAHGHVIIATRQSDGSATAAGTAVSISFAGVANPIWSGTAGRAALLRTELADGTVIDEASSGGTYDAMLPPTLTFTPGSFTGAPSVTSSSARAGDVVNLTVTFTATNPLPEGGAIVLGLPAHFLIDDAALGVWTSGCNETVTGAYDAGYRGCQSRTTGGVECQRWDSQSPHTHDRTVAYYPTRGLESNYCRNPDDYNPGLWCYTSDPATRFALCNPVSSSGLDGTYAITASGGSAEYGRNITILRQSDGTPTKAGQVLSFVLKGVRNQRYTGLTGDFEFMRTALSATGATIDETSSQFYPTNRPLLTTDIIQPGDLIAPTVHFESRVAAAEVNGFILRFVAANLIPVSGTVILTLPPGFAIDPATFAVGIQAAGDSPATLQVTLVGTSGFGGTTVTVRLTSSDSNAIDAVAPGEAVALAFTGTVTLPDVVEVTETFRLNTTLADGETVVDVALAVPGWGVRHRVERTNINSTIVGVAKYIRVGGRNISSFANDSIAWVPHSAALDADCQHANFVYGPVPVTAQKTALITFPHGSHCPTEALTYRMCYRFGSQNAWKLYRGFELLVRDVITVSVASGFVGANNTAVAGARKEFDYAGVGLANGDVLRYLSANVVAAAGTPGNSVCDDAAAGLVTVAAQSTLGSGMGSNAWKDLAGSDDAYRLCYEFSAEANATKHKLLSHAFSISVYELLPGFVGARFSSVQGHPRPALPLPGYGARATDKTKWIPLVSGEAASDASCGTSNDYASSVVGTDGVVGSIGELYNSVPLIATPLTAHNITFHTAAAALHLCYQFADEAYRLYGNMTMVVRGVNSIKASFVGADDVIVKGQPKSFTFSGPGIGANTTMRDAARWVPLPHDADASFTPPGHENATASSICGDAVTPWAASAQVQILASGVGDGDFTIPANGTYALCFRFAAHSEDDQRSGVDISAPWNWQLFPSRVVKSFEIFSLIGRDFGVGHVAVVDYPKAFAFHAFGVAGNDQVRFVNASVTTDTDCNNAITASGQSNLFEPSFAAPDLTAMEDQVNVMEASQVNASQSGLAILDVEFKRPSVDGLPWVMCYQFGRERWRAYPSITMIASRVDVVNGTFAAGVPVNVTVSLKPLGHNVRVADKMKWVDASVTTDAGCADHALSLGNPVSNVPGTVNGGIHGIGGVVSLISIKTGSSLAFTLPSPNGLPWKLCYAFGKEPFKLYINSRLEARAVLSMEALLPAGSADSVAVVGRNKIFGLLGSGLYASHGTVDTVSWLPFSVFNTRLTLNKITGATRAAEKHLYMTESSFRNLDLRCDETVASSAAISLTGAASGTETAADYSSSVKSSAVNTAAVAFSVTTAVASPRDEPFVLCYRMRGAAQAYFVPHIKLYSRTLLPAALSIVGAVALQPKIATLSLSGNGTWAGDRVRFVSGDSTSDVACRSVDPSTYLVASAPETALDGGADVGHSIASAAPLKLTFATPLADPLKLCVRFGTEPYVLFAASTLEVKGIASINHSLAVVGSTFYGGFVGNGLRDIVDNARWVDGSVTSYSQCGAAAPFGNSGLGAVQTFNANERSATTTSIGSAKEVGWTQWRFDAASKTALRLCYRFVGEEWMLFPDVTVTSFEPSVAALSASKLVVGLKETLKFTGGTIGAVASHRFKFVANDATGCEAAAEGGIGMVEIVDSNFGQEKTGDASLSASVVTFIASVSAYKPWQLCFAFGDGPLGLIASIGLSSVELMKIIDASATCETQIGVPAPFKFEGSVGAIADGDVVKFVSSAVASDAGCAAAAAIGGQQSVLNGGVSFTFSAAAANLLLCYRFGSSENALFRLYRSLPMRCTPTATSSEAASVVEAEENAETSVEMRMSGSYADVANKTAFGEQFAAGVALALGVPASRIVVQAVTSGSIIVNFIIMPPPVSASGAATAAAPSVAALVAELVLQAASNSSKLNAPGALPASIDASYAGGALSAFVPKAMEETTVSLVVTKYQSAGLFAFVSGSASVTEDSGSVVLNVTRAHGSIGKVYVQWSCAGGTARRNVDFTCAEEGGFLWFEDGQTSALLSIPIIDDASYEAHYESFTVSLSLLVGQPNVALGSLRTTTVLIYDYGDGVGAAGVAPATWGVRSGAGDAASLLGWSVVGNGAALGSTAAVDANGLYGTDAKYGREEFDAACEAASGPCTETASGYCGDHAPTSATGPGVVTLSGAASGSAIVLPAFNDFPTEELTVSFWLKSSAGTTGTVLSYSVEAGNVDFALHTSAGELSVLILDRFVGVRRGLRTGLTVADGKLHHVSVSWRSADGAVDVWLDGVRAWKSAGPYRSGRTLRRGGTLVIGQLAAGACALNASVTASCPFDAARAWSGSVQNVRVWSLILPAARRVEDVKFPFAGSQMGLRLYYRVDAAAQLIAKNGTSQAILADSSPIGNHTGVVSATGVALTGGTPSISAAYPCAADGTPDSQKVYKNVWFFRAPSSFTNGGDLSALSKGAGGRLQFRMMSSSHSGQARARRGDVVIESAVATISRSLDGFPLPSTGSGWHSYSVVLRSKGWKTEPSGAAVDAAMFDSVLASVDKLLIRGDLWVYGKAGPGSETLYVNNVTLTTAPM